nr:cyclic AMP response element-binding protein A [Danaus plexippus plexippus]
MESYFDISNDLKDVWDADIDPDMQDVLDEDSEMSDWLIERDSKLGVVLHDRLMTDAALGAAPIKTEHSYSLHSDVESAPPSPHHTKVDDMEDECYPAIPASAWRSRRRSSDSSPEVKAEPKSEPESPASSCPPSPTPTMSTVDYVIDHTRTLKKLVLIRVASKIWPSIHMPQAVLQKVGAAGVPQILLSAAPRIANSLNNNKLSIKVTSSGTSGFNLPPTPPSSLSSSDSEGALSPSHEPPAPITPAPPRRSHLYVSHHSRQPINTPLISSQPKGSTGTLVLTEEEKRTLLAEGYPVPTRLPLTKAEEKSLKKVRRKIKNKISAQESRRKKKEYMDQLERKVEILVSENTDYRKRVETLESTNANLLSQLAALQAMVRASRK